jgi:hypothetical protein
MCPHIVGALSTSSTEVIDMANILTIRRLIIQADARLHAADRLALRKTTRITLFRAVVMGFIVAAVFAFIYELHVV